MSGGTRLTRGSELGRIGGGRPGGKRLSLGREKVWAEVESEPRGTNVEASALSLDLRGTKTAALARRRTELRGTKTGASGRSKEGLGTNTGACAWRLGGELRGTKTGASARRVNLHDRKSGAVQVRGTKTAASARRINLRGTETGASTRREEPHKVEDAVDSKERSEGSA